MRWRPKPAVSKPSSTNASATNHRDFEFIQAFFDTTRGQITIGEIPPIRRAALAAVGKKVRVALVCAETESVADLQHRIQVVPQRPQVAALLAGQILSQRASAWRNRDPAG